MAYTEEERKQMDELRIYIADVFDIDEEEITDDAHFMNDLDLSSLMGLEAMVALEKKYQIKLTEDLLPKMTTLANVFSLLREKNAQFN